MPPPPFHRIRLERFPRGIDNIRIDVAFDPHFVGAISTLVNVILREDVHRYFWKVPLKAPNVEAVEVFRKCYVELAQAVISHARASARPDRVQLYQLAVFKLLLVLVDREMVNLRQELDDARAHPARQQSGRSLQLHERAVVFTRHAREIRFRALRDIVQQVMRLERSTVRKMRKTILGASWPVAEAMLTCPLLPLGGHGSAVDFIGFYPYLLHDDDKAASLFRCVLETFADWLPEGVQASGEPGAGVATEDRSRGGHEGVPGLAETERRLFRLVAESERDQPLPHAFDDAEAVIELLGGLDGNPAQPGRWKDSRMAGECRQRFKALHRRLQKAGLLTDIHASYLLQVVYPTLGAPVEVEPVYGYLRGDLSRKELAKRLAAQPGLGDISELPRRLDEQLKAQRTRDPQELRRRLLLCIRDAMRYRFDLKLAWWMFSGMDDLCLLPEPREIEMSRANGLLQEFGASMGAGDGALPAGHVVIKADVRGSTEITATMRARNLNPAAYFSRNLYDPINALIKAYGAEKVFVEGDAVILAILEQPGSELLAVARACGLAQRILEVVDRKNAESRRLELPQLELGLGIAYSSEIPTYLYDEGHKIMISSAINRADRLSSCAAKLRFLVERDLGIRRGLEVVSAVSARGEQDTTEDLLRYNVNGIELEVGAFYQLAVELKLHKLQLDGERGTFHVGRYPDVSGNAHWLVVREAPVRLWVSGQLVEENSGGRRFYEVVTDPQQRARLKERLSGRREK